MAEDEADRDETSEDRAVDNLAARQKAEQIFSEEVEGKQPDQEKVNHIIAQNVLREELGYYGDYDGTHYS